MKTSGQERALPQWAPRVEPGLIKKLYLQEASGIRDEALIDDVAIALYCRAESIHKATEAYRGTIECPLCGHLFQRRGTVYEMRRRIKCDACGWDLAWGDYHQTLKGKHLYGWNFESLLTDYLQRLPRATTPVEKLLLIDRLIHAVHKGSAKTAAVNFLRGTAGKLRQFLDDLAYADNMPEQLRTTKAEWDEEQRRYDRQWKVPVRGQRRQEGGA